MKQILSRLAIFLLVTPFAAAQAGQFVEAPQFATGVNPQAVAYGDFNHDGKLDLVVANSSSSTVSVLLGNGDGTFRARVDHVTGTTPEGVAVGDFNNDGKLDIAVTNSASNTVSIFLGNGDGSFQPKKDYATGNTPWGIAVGDFNRDGNLDVVVTNATDGSVSVLLGKGDGTFQAHADHFTSFNPVSVAVADLDGDGFLDLAVACNANTNRVSVLRGMGNGSFQSQLQFTTGANPYSVIAVDLNGDGFPDLAVADQLGNTVSVLLSNGSSGVSWNLLAHVDYPTAEFPTSLVAGDFNGDGKMDLAVSDGNGNSVSILLGNGDGTLQAQTNYGAGNIPFSIIAGDFNGDGKTDLVVANSGGNNVSVILGNGNGTFQTRIDYPSGPNPYSVKTGDFNGDGILDLAVANSNCAVSPCGPGTVSIVMGNGDGSFQSPVQYSTGTNTEPRAVAVGSFTSSKHLDLVVANNATNTVGVFLGNGDGTFEGHVDHTVGSGPVSVAVGDFNGDGKLDIVAANFNSDTVSVLLGNGDGTFKPAVSYAVGNGPISVAVADFNGDKKLDLVVVNNTDGHVSLLLGNGDGTFRPHVDYAVGNQAESVAVGDLNGDGKLDIAVANFNSATVSVLLGNGDGTFQTATAYPTGTNPSSIVTADFDGDGKLDLALTSTPLGSAPGNLVSLLLGKGDGSFGSPVLFSAGYLAYATVAGDFNGDGAMDLAVANGASNTVSVLLNAKGSTVALQSSGSPSVYGQKVTFTATVNASTVGSGTPTGTVTIQSGSAVLGSGPLSGGKFSASTTALPVGADSVSAAYSGDSHFQPRNVSLAQTVQKAGTSAVIASSANPGNPGTPVAFTITVAPSTTGTPTGSVSLLDGATVLGTAPLSASAATVSVLLNVGAHSITATYSGDSNFTASTAPVLTETISSPDFQVSPSPSSLTVTPPGSATSTITTSSGNGFDVTGVTLTCSVSSTASLAPTCTVGAMSVAGGTGSSTLTVKTTGPQPALAQHAELRRSGGLFALGLLLPAMLLGTGFAKQNRQKLLGLCLAFVVLSGCLLQVACGGGGSTNTGGGGGTPGTPAGQYTVTVTGNASGGLQHTATVNLTVE
ncbi:MAG: FG-GAP-like repeat-containing protein [Candidatus Sulfotelmatobacter sp.]